MIPSSPSLPHWSRKIKLKNLILSLLLVPLQVMAEPQENISQRLQRTAASEMLLKTQLSKNIYRSEAYDAEYDVQVPYQAEEQYYEDVPYEEDEAYTDYEQYYDTEYRCHNETRYDQVCDNQRICKTRTVNEQECHTEQRCENRPLPPRCTTERQCRQVPGHQVCQEVEECGTNSQGQRICKVRKVCQPGPDEERCSDVPKCEPGGTERQCQNENVCRNVPRQVEECGYEQVCRQVPRNENVCANEQVLKTRPVTRYRRVTKYRQELRTRTVTRYRTETRCCETRYRDVFDHAESLPVEILFPAGSELFGNESETATVDWVSSEKAELQIKSDIFKYQVVNEGLRGGIYRFELGLVAQYSQDELGAKSMSVKTGWEKTQAKLVIKDKGLRPRVKTTYQFIVKQGSTVVSQGEKINDKGQDIEVLLGELPYADVAYQVEYQVVREGAVLQEAIKFGAALNIPAMLSRDSLGEKSIDGLVLVIKDGKAKISFKDLANAEGVKTSFTFSVHDLDSKELIEQGDGSYTKQAKQEILLTSHFDEFKNHLLQLRVRREHPRLQQPIDFLKQFKLEASFTDQASYMDAKQLQAFAIKESQQSAVLSFKDMVNQNRGVKTQYKITISRKTALTGKLKQLAEKTFTQEVIKDNLANLSLKNDFAMSDADLKQYAQKGDKLTITLQATRTHALLNKGQPVMLKQETEVVIPK